MRVKYSLTLRVIHWTTAGLVFGQLLLVVLNWLLYEPRPELSEALVQAHISIGALILLLTILRIPARFSSPVPDRTSSSLFRFAASAAHTLLYFCLILMPVSGYLKLAALGFPVTLFGTLALPQLAVNIPLSEAMREVHATVAGVLLCVLVLHILAAVAHRRLDGNSVMPNMTFSQGGTDRAMQR